MRIKQLTIAICAVFCSVAAYAQQTDYDNAKETALPSGLHINETAKPIKHNYIVWSIAPIQFSENGVGLGISYEHNIDAGGIVNFYMPVVGTFNPSRNIGGEYSNDPMFYVMPGLKFYPTTCYGKIKYAIGPSLVLGMGTQKNYYYDYFSSYYPPHSEVQNRFLLGVMINNSLNFQPTKHLYLGLEFGLGFTYIDKLAGGNNGVTAITQGGFKLGYRL